MAWRLVFRHNLEPIYAKVCSRGIRTDLFVGCCRQHLLCDSKKRIHSSAPGHSPTKIGEQPREKKPREKKLADKVKTPVGHGLASSEDIIVGNDGSEGHAVQHPSPEGHSPTKTGEQPREKKLADKVKTPVGHGLASSEDIIVGNDGSKGHAVQHPSPEGHSPTKTRGRPRQKKLTDKVKTPVGHELASIEDVAGGNAGSNGHPVFITYREAMSKEKFQAELDEITKTLDLRSWGTHEGGKVYLNGVCYDSDRDPTYRRKRRENFLNIAKTLMKDAPPCKESYYEILCRLRGRRPYYEDPVYVEEERKKAVRAEARRRRRAQQKEKNSSLS